ncbi:MAG: DUF4214 domain-containing protein, partial [Cellulomonadaceae bacterium]|nr:DUF4214 domain-containing protein [Cellulomonadaceae bacterium]
MGPRRAARRRGTGARRLVGLVLVWFLVQPTAAVAVVGDRTLSVSGTLVQLVVDRPESGSGSAPGAATASEAETALEIRTVVEVDGALLPVPDALGTVPGRTGDAVVLSVVADASLGRAAAIDALARPLGEEARIAGVTTTAPIAASTTVEPLARGATGAQTLTILPVYWTTPDAATTSSLQGVANATSQYWSEQTAGRLAIATDVRGWAKISDPGSCSTNLLYSRALAAHGLTALAPGQHVLVYFPQRADCGGWAGLASIGGENIWINGSQNLDVMAHEYGHNLGLGHANVATCYQGSRVTLAPLASCTRSEYADRADVMGIGLSARTGNLTTAFADYLGLASVVRPTAGEQVSANLAPLATVSGSTSVANVGAVRSIALPVAEGVVYVDYRPAVGRDVRVPAWAGVQVHLRTIDPTIGYPTTYLLDMRPTTASPFASPSMPVGATWTIPGTSQTLTAVSVGVAAAQMSVRPVAADPALVSYVTRVYQDLFGRAVDAGGLVTWTSLLAAGTPRIAVASSITSSTEFRSGLIADSYATYLGRAPDAGGLRYWLSLMAQGVTIQQMEAGFLASPEYYSRAGSTDAGWVGQLYTHVLSREASGTEVRYWTSRLAAGTTRAGVALGFLLSTEHLTTEVDDQYRALLGRSIDAAGGAYWVLRIQGGT